MRVLIVEDEEGIREGLAAFLRHHGHAVHAAASCAGARVLLASEPLDAMVTDWRLEDGTAEVLLGSSVPTIVITGCPDEILAEGALVLHKPVLPVTLLARLHELVAPAPSTSPATLAAAIAGLPVDAQDRVQLLLSQLAADEVVVEDDGTFVAVRLRVCAPADAGLLDALGGDWSPHAPVAGTGPGAHLKWRCYRDGRPASVARVIGIADPWPAGSGFAIDLHATRVGIEEFLALVERVRDARAGGHEVHVLNVPAHLRLLLELTGRAGDLPMRACSGPLLRPEQRQLWNSACTRREVITRRRRRRHRANRSKR